MEKYWADRTFERSVRERGRQLEDGLKRVASLVEGAAYRGRGLLAGVWFPDPDLAERISQAAFERHLLVETSGPRSEVLKAMPPLNIAPEDLEEGIEVLVDSTRAAAFLRPSARVTVPASAELARGAARP